ncbi:hypothetical protein LEP1GSC196_0618 [Leptospira meyeri serovar Semaranga str. Veldrot Semarang 173]|nr:hypothetical protein LEP1GSC196_0618 [Leptospira meyeri serovar Semaranga str. Veldrot Semarang 173]
MKLVRITPDPKLKRKIGLYQGKLKISEDFFEPLPEDSISGFHS